MDEFVASLMGGAACARSTLANVVWVRVMFTTPDNTVPQCTNVLQLKKGATSGKLITTAQGSLTLISLISYHPKAATKQVELLANDKDAIDDGVFVVNAHGSMRVAVYQAQGWFDVVVEEIGTLGWP